MDADLPVPPRPDRLPGQERLLLAVVALVPVLCAFSARDLWAPDEPRYGQVAREMMDRDDWLVPHANGQPYAEKPPVYWWGVQILSQPTGRVSAVTARLGGALYALGCILLLARLARRWFGDARVGVTAAILFASMWFVLWNGQRAGLDLPLTFYVLLAVERGEVWLSTGRLLPAALCGAAWAAAILVKGPLGFLLPPAALAAGAVGARRAPAWRNAGWLLAPGVMAALCLAWLLPALEAGGEAYGERLLGQIKGRATGAEGHHIRPVYYYLYNAAALALPWSMHLLAGVAASFRPTRAPEAHRRGLATCFALGVGGMVFLSALATKRHVYLIPLLPFVSAATAYALHRGLYPRIERLGRWIALGTLVGMAAVLAAAPLLGRYLLMKGSDLPAGSLDASAYLYITPGVLVFLGGAWAAWRVRAEPLRMVRRTALSLLAASALTVLLFLPRLDHLKSYAPAAHAAEDAAAGGTIYNAGFGQGPNLLWSLDRKVTPVVWTLEDLLRALPESGPRAAVVAEQGWWERVSAQAPAQVKRIREAWREPVDHRALVVLTNARD